MEICLVMPKEAAGSATMTALIRKASGSLSLPASN